MKNAKKTLIKTVLVAACLTTPGAALSGHHEKSKSKKEAIKIFEPGVVSTGKELSITFSPDMSVLYFSRRLDPNPKDNPENNEYIFWSQKTEDGWSEPQMTPYSGDYSMVDPMFSPDGSKLLLMTTLPLEGEEASPDSDVWIMERQGERYSPDAWGDPVYVGADVNVPETREGGSSVTAKGDLYFFSNRPGPNSQGSYDLYLSRFKGGEYQPVENLGPVLNSDSWEAHAFVSPDEDYLIFTSGREAGYGSCDLYVTYKNEVGSWGTPLNLGPEINTEHCDMLGVITPDKKHFFFTRSGDEIGSNIYFMKISDVPAFEPMVAQWEAKN